MDIKEFNAEVKVIQERALAAKTILVKKFAIINNKVKVGNTVTDHIGSVIVEKIGIYNDEVPGCFYTGVMLTTKGVVFKSGERRTVYQSNLQSLNGEPIKK